MFILFIFHLEQIASCRDVGPGSSQILLIDPGKTGRPFPASCDMNTDGGKKHVELFFICSPRFDFSLQNCDFSIF